jgi:hypothetical protein
VRHLFILPILASLLLAGMAPARAQTGGPVATPTPGENGTALLSAMRSAMLAAGTLHAVLDVSGNVPNQVTVSTEVITDVSFKDGALHTSTTSVRTNLVKHTSTSDRSELKLTGSQGAWRVPHMKWQCEKLLPQDVSGDLVAFQARPAAAQIAGTGAVGGVQVWKVVGKAVVAPWTGPKKLDAVEFDIAQGTGLPVQISTRFSTHWGRAMAQETLVERYSNFGAPLSITLPHRCR